jgi:hypothetical protein
MLPSDRAAIQILSRVWEYLRYEIKTARQHQASCGAGMISWETSKERSVVMHRNKPTHYGRQSHLYLILFGLCAWLIESEAASQPADPALRQPLIAQTCTANCGSRQIQFTPGQAVRLQMANRTSSLVRVQQRPLTDTIALPPGAEVEISSNFGTEPNLSVIFWDETNLGVRAVLFRPEPNLLRIELIPGSGTGDRSVYIENDGRVRLF